MDVSDGQVAALRAYLAQQPNEMDLLHQELVQAGADGYGKFVYAAFVTAVRRRFDQTWTVPEVVRLVATVRSELLREGYDVDPLVAERQVRRALGDDEARVEADEETRGRAQLFLLGELIHSEHLDEAALEEFLTQARALAEQSLTAES